MNKPLSTIGYALGAAILTGEALANDFPDQSSPVLYDTASPQGAFMELVRNPDMHSAYAEQVLQVLERTLAEGGRMDLSPSTPGTVITLVSKNLTDNQWIITGQTNMKDDPYVYADNITLTSPFCGEQGTTHLTVRFRTQSDASGVKLSVTTDAGKTESKATWDKSRSIVRRKEIPEHTDAYKEQLQKLVCSLK